MLVSTPRETFVKERERVRLNVQVAEMFFISLEQIFIQYVDLAQIFLDSLDSKDGRISTNRYTYT